ncbi:MAG: HD domain-containing protein [Calditrichaeota bacterium]|nr:HD domain-containing protein [Calditrichota bacterium]
MTVTLATTPELKTVREYSANDHVQGFYLLTKIETRNKKNGEPFLVIELTDASGKIDGKMWDGFDDALDTLHAGDAVFVDGRVDIYQSTAGLTLATLRKATVKEVPDRTNFLPHSELSATKANEELMSTVESIKDSFLKKLLSSVFDDLSFRKRYLETPGGKNWHHSTVGGLAEHTLSMVKLAEFACERYPQLNRDLLITGTLLHDVGKVLELTFEPTLDYTSEGRLVGHITLGTLLIEEKIRAIENFPGELRKQLLHIVLSHQGEPEKGSAVKPMTLEALVLHYLDELDSRVSAFEQVRARTPETQEFSDYQRLMERFFYFRPADDEGE